MVRRFLETTGWVLPLIAVLGCAADAGQGGVGEPLILTGAACDSDADCDDGDACTWDFCAAELPQGKCVVVPQPQLCAVDAPLSLAGDEGATYPEPLPDEPAPPVDDLPRDEPACPERGTGTGAIGMGGGLPSGADLCASDCDCAAGHLCVGEEVGSGICLETCEGGCDIGSCSPYINSGYQLCSIW